MNTIDAYKLAMELADNGTTYVKISRELARRGYISYRTGKPLTKAGIAIMVSRMRRGIFPKANRKTIKHSTAKGRYLPRKQTTTLTTPTIANTLSDRIAAVPMNEVTAQAFLGARAALEALHSYHLTVAANLRILLDAVK